MRASAAQAGPANGCSDQASIGFAQQIGTRFAAQADFVHTAASNIQMSRNINFFEDPVRHVPVNPGTVVVNVWGVGYRLV